MLRGIYIHRSQVFLVEMIEILSWLLQLILFVLCAIFLLRWMYRAYQNLGQFERLQYSENMAVVGWFLPVFSWFGPFMIYSAIVRGFEEVLIKQQYIRKNSRRISLKNWWWITWVAGGLILVFGFGYERFNLFCSAFSTGILMLSNLLLISSLSDIKMMEEGIAGMKNVSASAPASDDLLDDFLE
ncbi:MAG: DUF4328 domain-containing protein [bacterium]|nr:DUF4328 domain-containing protein [bacterium]